MTELERLQIVRDTVEGNIWLIKDRRTVAEAIEYLRQTRENLDRLIKGHRGGKTLTAEKKDRQILNTGPTAETPENTDQTPKKPR